MANTLQPAKKIDTKSSGSNVTDSITKLIAVVVLFRSVASRLDNTWKGFASGLDERTTVLALSVLFHQKAENVSTIIASSYVFQTLKILKSSVVDP
jgi:hypothetical protein